ncbi:MAG: hypothetical protein ACRDHE_08800 [Ktedonobacterales bacterium]
MTGTLPVLTPNDAASITVGADLLGMTFDELRDWLSARGQAGYRAAQLLRWVYWALVDDFAAMTNLPAALRETLAAEATIAGPHVRTSLAAKDGRTRKLLLELADGRLIETVLMLYPATDDSRARATVCVSTQAGCAYGCTFCATGQMGFDRHLTPGEIVAQVVYFARELRRAPWTAPDGQTLDHVTNLVFMGMGEPFHNYDNTLHAVRVLNMPEGLNIGARHMTVSTVGAGSRHPAPGTGAAPDQPRDLAARAQRQAARAHDAHHAQVSHRGGAGRLPDVYGGDQSPGDVRVRAAGGDERRHRAGA